jgi:hypothetical protein
LKDGKDPLIFIFAEKQDRKVSPSEILTVLLPKIVSSKVFAPEKVFLFGQKIAINERGFTLNKATLNK